MLLIKDLLLWIYWNPFRLFVQKRDASCVYRLAQILGDLLYHLSRDRRKRLEHGLKIVSGRSNSARETRRTVRNAFKIHMCNELEVLLFPVLNARNISSFVACSGLENLDNALLSGKGVMLMFAHFGANQMIMPAIGYKGHKMSQMSAPPTVWTEKLPNRKFTLMSKKALETRWKHELALPVTHINIFGSLKKAFLCLKRNEILGVAMDGGGGKSRVGVNFLGKRTMFSTGPMEIAVRTGCTVLPTFMVRDRNGRNTMTVEPPLELVQTPGVQEAVKENIQRFVEKLEKSVTRYPCHYLNFLALREFMHEQGDDPFFVDRGEA